MGCGGWAELIKKNGPYSQSFLVQKAALSEENSWNYEVFLELKARLNPDKDKILRESS